MRKNSTSTTTMRPVWMSLPPQPVRPLCRCHSRPWLHLSDVMCLCVVSSQAAVHLHLSHTLFPPHNGLKAAPPAFPQPHFKLNFQSGRNTFTFHHFHGLQCFSEEPASGAVVGCGCWALLMAWRFGPDLISSLALGWCPVAAGDSAPGADSPLMMLLCPSVPSPM
ncbi:hypothetical protein WMY93_016226 [Mugilogobius chulae]|uniref:Uncharacterized protein n=1 Tax=Mugilogobius chulae TaxID=88201 RepID=A0AAW0NX12_9GOBI